MPFRTICSPVGGSQAVCLAKSALQAFSCFLTVPPFHPVWIQKMEIFFHAEKYFHAISYKPLVSPYFMALTSICSSTILLNSWRRDMSIFSAAFVIFPLVVRSMLRINSRSKLALASL